MSFPVNAVRRSFQQSLRRTARKHVRSLQISDRSVRRIFHPYKMVVVQQLCERDYANRVRSCANILENVPENPPVLFSDEAHFHFSG